MKQAGRYLTRRGFLVDRPLRFPSVSRVRFIECAGNAGREHRVDPGPTAQLSHGLVS